MNGLLKAKGTVSSGRINLNCQAEPCDKDCTQNRMDSLDSTLKNRLTEYSDRTHANASVPIQCIQPVEIS